MFSMIGDGLQAGGAARRTLQLLTLTACESGVWVPPTSLILPMNFTTGLVHFFLRTSLLTSRSLVVNRDTHSLAKLMSLNLSGFATVFLWAD